MTAWASAHVADILAYSAEDTVVEEDTHVHMAVGAAEGNTTEHHIETGPCSQGHTGMERMEN